MLSPKARKEQPTQRGRKHGNILRQARCWRDRAGAAAVSPSLELAERYPTAGDALPALRPAARKCLPTLSVKMRGKGEAPHIHSPRGGRCECEELSHGQTQELHLKEGPKQLFLSCAKE